MLGQLGDCIACKSPRCTSEPNPTTDILIEAAQACSPALPVSCPLAWLLKPAAIALAAMLHQLSGAMVALTAQRLQTCSAGPLSAALGAALLNL